ncbi:hypothetical protein Athai_07840 [Actinocatenispora thailandica]|uniref:PI3K/PI4K catalytic domain-containing protein n=2 Tax=Actinocatenispora thailandica TaxID=227318 RepID=A0A7R7DKJ0_9ACTN|nr:ADP-ribosyltransferase [Actinocatenispora thailandica]BCJ33281.1 hypothetical protein Athai_07840 [Actinocatenispora thailandica]
MLDPARNDAAARAFQGLTAEEIRAGVARIRDITPEQIDALIDRAQLPAKEALDLRFALKARREYLIERYLDAGHGDAGPVDATDSSGAQYAALGADERRIFDAEVASRLNADHDIEHIHEVLRHALVAEPLAGRGLTVADAAALVDAAQARLYGFGNAHDFQRRITHWLGTPEGQIADRAWDGYDPRDAPPEPSPATVRQLVASLRGIDRYDGSVDHDAWSRRLYDGVMGAIRERAGVAAEHPIHPLDVARMLDVARADGGPNDHHFERQLVEFVATPEGRAHAAGHAALDAELADPRPLPESSARFPETTTVEDMDRVHADQGGDWPTESRAAYRTYLDGNYQRINGWQRDRLPRYADQAPVCEAMDRGMRASSEHLLLRRGVSLDALGVSSPAELPGLLGRELADPGFMPTSAAERAGFQAERFQLELEVPAGTRLAWLGRLSPRPEQAEVLLAPDTRIVGMRLERRYFQGEVQYVLRARVVGQGEARGEHPDVSPGPDPAPASGRPAGPTDLAAVGDGAGERPVPDAGPAIEPGAPGADRDRAAGWRDEAVDQQRIAAEERLAEAWHRVRVVDHQRRIASAEAERARAVEEQRDAAERLGRFERDLDGWTREADDASGQRDRSATEHAAASAAHRDAQARLAGHEQRLASHLDQLRQHADRPEGDWARYADAYHQSRADSEHAAAEAVRAEVAEFERQRGQHAAAQQHAEQRYERSQQAIAELRRRSAAERELLADLDARRVAAEQEQRAARDDAARTEQEARSAAITAGAAEERAWELSAQADEAEGGYPDRAEQHLDLLRRELSRQQEQAASARRGAVLSAGSAADELSARLAGHERQVELLTTAIDEYGLAATLQRSVRPTEADAADSTAAHRVRGARDALSAQADELAREAGRAAEEAVSGRAAAETLRRSGVPHPDRVVDLLRDAGRAEERAATLRAQTAELTRRAERVTALLESFTDRWQQHGWARDAEFAAAQVRGWADWHDFRARQAEALAADLAAGGEGLPARSAEVLAVAASRAELAGQQVDRLNSLGGGINGTYRAMQGDRVIGAFKPADAEVFAVEGQVIRHGIPAVPGQLAGREVAASDFAELLGSTLVPPTVPMVHQGRPGSLQRWVADSMPSRPVDDYPLAEQQEIAVIDFVLGNTDRNQGNFLTVDDSVVAIDHGLVLSESARDQLQSPFVEAQLRTRLNADLMTRLRRIDAGDLRERLESRGIGVAAVDAAIARLREVQANGMIVFAERDEAVESGETPRLGR